MKELTGMTIQFDFGKLKKQADLIVCDGPLLSHYATTTGDQYLLYWVDADDTCNRWLMLRTNLEILRNYVGGSVSLYEVITHPEDEFVWITDLDSNMHALSVCTMPVQAIPHDYLPEKSAMYCFENEDPLLQGELDSYQLNLPQKDSNFFKEFIAKMGWHANSISLGKRIAVF